MKQCPKCQSQWDDLKRFCPYDGTPLPSSVLVAEHQSTSVMSASAFPASDSIPSSVESVFPGALVVEEKSAPPVPPIVHPALRSTDDTPTMKAQDPKVVWSTPRQVPALPDQPSASESSGKSDAKGDLAAWGAQSPDEFMFHFEEAPKPRIDDHLPPTVQVTPSKPTPQFVPAPNIPPPGEADAEVPKTMSVFEVARQALDRKRSQTPFRGTASPHRTHAEFFQLLNQRNRIVQQYVDLLGKQGFHYTSSYSNRDDCLVYKFILTYKDPDDPRSFPISVTLFRKPKYSVVVSIDLKHIGTSAGERHKRTELVGGLIEQTDNGPIFRLDATEDLPNEYLMQWLDENFKNIFQVAYGE